MLCEQGKEEKNAFNMHVKACNRKTDNQLPKCFVQSPITASSIKVLTKYMYFKTLQTQISPPLKITWVKIQHLIHGCQMTATLLIQQHMS
jgi:hypothetical protein